MPGIRKSALILGGTREAADLAERLEARGDWQVISSLAGRTQSPELPAGEIRIGGFGGTEGLAEYLVSENIDLLIDATHPFASTITRNAIEAASRAGTRLMRLDRPPWISEPGDRWTSVASEKEACVAIPKSTRVFLALGRQYVDAFANRDDVHFVLRMVDSPDRSLPFADSKLLIGKPSPDVEAEAAMLQKHGIGLIVCRNSGGAGSYAKIAAARRLSLPVIMIERPEAPEGQTFATVDALMETIA